MVYYVIYWGWCFLDLSVFIGYVLYLCFDRDLSNKFRSFMYPVYGMTTKNPWIYTYPFKSLVFVKFLLLKEINTFIQWGCIKLIKSDSKFYKYFLLHINVVLNLLLIRESYKIYMFLLLRPVTYSLHCVLWNVFFFCCCCFSLCVSWGLFHKKMLRKAGIKVQNLTWNNLTNQSGLKRFHKRQFKFTQSH